MKRILSFILIVLAGIPSFADAAVQEESPRAAVVISRTSYSARENEVSGAAKSWTATASLAGIPYSTLFVEDLADDSLTERFDVFVLTQCTFLTDSEYDVVCRFVDRISGTGAGLIVDAPLGLFDEQEDYRENLTADEALGISVSFDYVPVDGFRLRVADNRHFVTSPYGQDAPVSNFLASELPVLTLEDGRVLVNMTDDCFAYPYLSVRGGMGFRLAVIDGLSSSACVGASFKNYEPKGFFPSEVYLQSANESLNLRSLSRSFHPARNGGMTFQLPALRTPLIPVAVTPFHLPIRPTGSVAAVPVTDGA